MGRRKIYTPKSFESIGGKRLSANIYISMLESTAWKQLSKNSRLLYVYMKAQYYGAKNIPEHPATDFVFNWGLASQTYGLYTNKTQFAKDKSELIKYGFIECVENGKCTRTKSIYRFSDKWQSFGYD